MALRGIASWRWAWQAAVVALAAMAVAVEVLPRAVAVERLTNGGFEEDTVGWTPVGLDFATSCPGDESPAAARLTVSGPTGRLVSAPMAIDPYGTYLVAGSASLGESPPLDTQVWAGLRWYASADGTGPTLGETALELLTWVHPTESYSRRQTAVSPLEGARSVRLLIHVSSQQEVSACVDNLSFDGPPPPVQTPTPPPGSTAAPRASATPTPALTPTRTAVPTRTPTPGPTAIPFASLLNRDCEQAGAEGRPAAWLKFGGTLSQTGDSPHGGVFTCALTSTTDSTKWAYQVVRVQGGRAYRLQGYLRLPSPGSRAWLRISWYDSGDGSGSTIQQVDSPELITGPQAVYILLSTDAVLAPPNAGSARVRVMLAPASAAPTTVFWDDLSFAETEPPTPEATATSTPVPAATSMPQETEPTSPAPPMPSRQKRESGGTSEVAAGGRSLPAPDSPFALKISEILYEPAGSEEAAREWVELYNAGPQSLDLAGWRLADNSSGDALPPAKLAPGRFLVVAGGEAFRDDFPSFKGAVIFLKDGKLGNGLANDGDRVLLIDPQGRPADAVSYGDDEDVFDPPMRAVAPGHSLERIDPRRDTDTAADFRDNQSPSPGRGPRRQIATPSPAARAVSQVKGAQTPLRSGGGPPWIWLIVAGAVFVGGVGAGVGGVSLWLRRR